MLVNIYRAGIAQAFRRIHMAGPNLNAETFVRGLFSSPPTGGQPRVPLVFMTRESPAEIKDAVVAHGLGLADQPVDLATAERRDPGTDASPNTSSD